jgi:hypothetical protein
VKGKVVVIGNPRKFVYLIDIYIRKAMQHQMTGQAAIDEQLDANSDSSYDVTFRGLSNAQAAIDQMD